MLYERASELVGSPLSLNAQREDLEASHSAVKTWLLALERVYAIFRISPYGPPRVRAVKKEQKLYMWDWARVEKRGARWENLVACHLLSFVHWAQDVWGEDWDLRFFRSPLGHEVDFVLLRNKKPVVAIEVKSTDEPTDRGLRLLCSKAQNILALQVFAEGPDETVVDTSTQTPVFHLPLSRFLAALP
jgi:predicted AAA+ superfamily ATPase